MEYRYDSGYGKVVDEALRSGAKYAEDNLRRYDVAYFAKVLWQIGPFYDWSDKWPREKKIEANGLLENINLCILSGNKKATRSDLAKIVALAHRMDRDLPVPTNVPLPRWAQK